MTDLTPTPVLYHVSRALSSAFECPYVQLCVVDIKYSRAAVCGIQVVGAVLCSNVSYMVTDVCWEGSE